jgi:phosphopantothenoylcysteine decarboxylase/phosphopantothenate--cysteine ligase
MDQQRSLFIFVTAAGSARRAGELIRGALASGWTTYVVGTLNLEQIAPAETLLDLPGARWIRDYGQPPLDIFPFGTMLVAPCTFNTFNKLACGLADNLATAMIADALGAGRPIFIAPSMNPGLWNHPQTRKSHQQLRAWGCTIIDPQVSASQVSMATTDIILSVLRQHFQYATQ